MCYRFCPAYHVSLTFQKPAMTYECAKCGEFLLTRKALLAHCAQQHKRPRKARKPRVPKEEGGEENSDSPPPAIPIECGPEVQQKKMIHFQIIPCPDCTARFNTHHGLFLHRLCKHISLRDTLTVV